MLVWTEPSTKTVFQNARPDANSSAKLSLISARNAYVSGQIILRDLADFVIQKVRILGGSRLKKRLFVQEYRLFNDQVAYPDELTEIPLNQTMEIRVSAHTAKSLWVDFYVSKTVLPETIEMKAEVETSAGTVSADISLKICKTEIPDSKDGLFNLEYFFHLSPAEILGEEKQFGEHWWRVMEKTADLFKELRNNAIIVYPRELLAESGSRRIGPDKWEFHFETWDRYVQFFLQKGVAKSFSVFATIQSVYGKNMSILDENGEMVQAETPSLEAEAFLFQMFEAISQHTRANGTFSMFRAHLQDEPHITDTWLWAREIVRKAAPGLPCSEPIDMIESAYGLKGACDLMIPRTNVYEEDVPFFKKEMKKRDLWVYSCCYPEEGWWLNKFVDMPFIRSRIMEWNLVGQGIAGFLHWGFNFFSVPAYGVGPEARFKGDGHIVYPDPASRGYKLSSRFINTRDGMQDAELLLLKMKKAPRETRRIIRRVVRNNYVFSDDPKGFDTALRQIYEI